MPLKLQGVGRMRCLWLSCVYVPCAVPAAYMGAAPVRRAEEEAEAARLKEAQWAVLTYRVPQPGGSWSSDESGGQEKVQESKVDQHGTSPRALLGSMQGRRREGMGRKVVKEVDERWLLPPREV
eukprot:3387530-Rhodomonas_salina.2